MADFDQMVKRQRRVPHGTFAAISVTDPGSGMPAEVLERVFERFLTTQLGGFGTGLGLTWGQASCGNRAAWCGLRARREAGPPVMPLHLGAATPCEEVGSPGPAEGGVG